MAGAGDVDGDGLLDIALGAPGDPTAGSDAGSVGVVFGVGGVY